MNATPALSAWSRTKTLLLREWMQHRFGWTMMLLIPFAIAVLTIPVANYSVDSPGEGPPPEAVPLIVTLASVLGTAAVMAVVAVIASLIFAITSPRRDHGDRSIEFWLSMPIPHSASLGVPLAVHLLLVPAIALLIGFGLGHIIGFVVALRLGVLGDLPNLPWGSLYVAMLAVAVRMAAGLALAALWLAPLLMLMVLAYALLRLWGHIALAAATAVLATLESSFGVRTLGRWIESIFQGVASAFPHGNPEGMAFTAKTLPDDMARMPMVLIGDFLSSLAALASPTFIGGAALATALFMALVVWRQRGAGMV